MSKPKIPSNMINAKFPNNSEICVITDYLKKQENGLKIVKCFFFDARTTKTLISDHFLLLYKNHAYFTDIT